LSKTASTGFGFIHQPGQQITRYRISPRVPW